MMEKIITVVAKDQQGLLATVTDILAKANININCIEGSAYYNDAILHIDINETDLQYALNLLTQAGFHAMTNEMITIAIDDKAGSLANIAKQLNNEQINVRGLTILKREAGKVVLVLSTNDNPKAKELLNEYLV